MVQPSARRELVSYFQAQHHFSLRRACRLAGISRKAMAYRPVDRDDEALKARLKALGERYPRYGYLLLHAMLRSEGLVRNRKRTYRLYTELGMQVRTKRRKKLVRPRVPMSIPTRVDERWSMDFIHDQLSDGRRLRILNIVDDFSRACVGQLVDTSTTGQRLARYLEELKAERGLPRTIVLDNGPEMTSKAMFFWSQEASVKLHFIQPEKPTQNAIVESFNGRFRDSCLNLHWFRDIHEAREVISRWRTHYNTKRPHSALGYQPPARFEKRAA